MKTNKLKLLSIAIVFLMIISGCSQKSLPDTSNVLTQQVQEKAYQQLVERVKATNWSKAEPKDWDEVNKTIQELQDYQDTPIIARYINYLRYIKENKLDNAIGIINNLPADYNGDFKEEISKIKLEAKNLAKAKDLRGYEELIRKGDYETLRIETVEKVSMGDEYNALYNYVSALEYQKKGIRSGMIISLSHITMPYKGLLADEITKMVNENASEIQKTRDSLSGKTSVGKPKPFVGMTKEEVLASSWGEPKNVVNTPLDATGRHEQWEYSDSKIVFIDNGFVTAIQY